MSVAHPFFIVILFSAYIFFCIAKPGLPYRQSCHAPKSKSGQSCRQHLFVVPFRIFFIAKPGPSTSANRFTMGPIPGYHAGTPTMHQRKLQSGKACRQFFCLIYFYFASRSLAGHASNPRALVRSPIPSTTFGEVFGERSGWLLVVMDEFSITFALYTFNSSAH